MLKSSPARFRWLAIGGVFTSLLLGLSFFYDPWAASGACRLGHAQRHEDCASLGVAGRIYASALTVRGIGDGDRGNLNGAILDFDRALSIRPNFAAALNDRGLAYATQGRHDRSIQDYDHGLALKPAYIHALLNRASYQAIGEVGRAAADFRKVAQIDPSNPNAAQTLKRLISRTVTPGWP